MTLRLTAADPRTGRRSLLAVAQVGPPTLARHPNDGWRLADPYPLGAYQTGVLRAVIRALCPPEPALFSPALARQVEADSRRLLRYMQPVVARALCIGLVLLDFLPIVTFESRHRFHVLDGTHGSALLARWSRSGVRALRLLIQGLRAMVLSVYFDQREVHAAMHYAPEPFMRDRIRLREQRAAHHGAPTPLRRPPSRTSDHTGLAPGSGRTG